MGQAKGIYTNKADFCRPHEENLRNRLVTQEPYRDCNVFARPNCQGFIFSSSFGISSSLDLVKHRFLQTRQYGVHASLHLGMLWSLCPTSATTIYIFGIATLLTPLYTHLLGTLICLRNLFGAQRYLRAPQVQ